MAILMTMKAKWYQREMEKTRMRVISYERLASEAKNMRGRTARFFSPELSMC
jgi:hypothetical protein